MNDLIDDIVDEMGVTECCIAMSDLLVSWGIPVDETPTLYVDSNLIAMRKLLKALLKLAAKMEIAK